MAISKNIRVHPDFPSVPGYMMIESITQSRISGGIQFKLLVFAGKEKRDQFGAAVNDVLKFKPIVDAGDQASKIEMPPNPSDSQIAEVNASREKATAEFQDGCRSYDKAIQAANSVVMVEPLGIERNLVVPPLDVVGCCDADGRADVALCYAWLMTQPGYEGTKD